MNIILYENNGTGLILSAKLSINNNYTLQIIGAMHGIFNTYKLGEIYENIESEWIGNNCILLYEELDNNE